MIYAPRPGTYAEKALDILRSAGRAMRTPEIAEAGNMNIVQVSTSLSAAVAHGLVTMCKVTHPNGAAMNEYRLASGIPLKSQGDYSQKKKPISTRRPADPPAPALPIRAAASSAQPEVAPALDVRYQNNTGSDPQAEASRPAAVAVAAPALREATPEPKADTRELGRETPKAPAGNVSGMLGKLGFSIDDGGAVTIYLNDGMSDPLELDADETIALGDFLHATEGLWRP